MNVKLHDIYPWSDLSKIIGKFVLLLDSQVPGSNHHAEFLLTSFLLRTLQTKSRSETSSSIDQCDNVLLLLCNHPLRHYEAIMRKNFIDPKQLYQKEKLHIVNIYAEERDKSPTLPASGHESHMTLDELLDWSKEGFLWPHSTLDKPYLLLVDDIDVLELLWGNAQVCRTFFNHILQQIYANYIPNKGIVGAVAYGHPPGESQLQFLSMDLSQPQVTIDHSLGARYPLQNVGLGYAAEPLLVEYLRYRADIMISAQPLQTGSSSAVHGVLDIATKYSFADSRQGGGEEGVDRSRVQYKALDSGITCTYAK